MHWYRGTSAENAKSHIIVCLGPFIETYIKPDKYEYLELNACAARACYWWEKSLKAQWLLAHGQQTTAVVLGKKMGKAEPAKEQTAYIGMDFAPGPFSGKARAFPENNPQDWIHSSSACSTSRLPGWRQYVWKFGVSCTSCVFYLDSRV